MNELELTEEEAAAVLAGALRNEAEAGRKVSQAELMNIAREAGLSETAVLDELAKLRSSSATPSTSSSFDAPLDAFLPMSPQQAVGVLAEAIEVTKIESTRLGLECTVAWGKQKLRARLEPVEDGCIVQPLMADPQRLTLKRTLAVITGVVFLGPFLETLSRPTPESPIFKALVLLLGAALLISLVLLAPFPKPVRRLRRARRGLELLIRAAFGREVFQRDSLRSRWDARD